MEIQEAIVHRIRKERHVNAELQPRNDVLPIDERLTKLIESVREVFNRTSNRGYGAFQDAVLTYPFSGELKKYVDGEMTMPEFTSAVLPVIKREIDKATLSTGGYLFFTRYTEADKDFLLVLILKLKPGTSIDESTLLLNESIRFDIDNLREAARVNLSSWQEEEERYVTFVKRGRDADKSATDYFRDFLGVTELSESSQQTKMLIEALNKYNVVKELGADKFRDLRQRLHSYCAECTKEKKGISLIALSSRFDDQAPEDFSQFIIDQDIQLSDGFEPNAKVYRTLQRYRIKNTTLTLDFEESILGSRVVYDQVTESIIIRDLPEDLKARLKSVTAVENAPPP